MVAGADFGSEWPRHSKVLKPKGKMEIRPGEGGRVV